MTLLPILVGCGGLPAPAQYDHAMLREYFGKSPSQVEDAFGKPASVRRADSKSVYPTVDGDLVFHFNRDDKVDAIFYAGKTVSPPDPPTSKSE